ncbi:hypothetical protein, partial [Saccharophagus degradans]
TKGRYSLRHFTLTGKEGKLTIKQHKSGSFITSYETFKINLIGLPFEIKTIKIDSEEISFEDLKLTHRTFEITKNFNQLQVIG